MGTKCEVLPKGVDKVVGLLEVEILSGAKGGNGLGGPVAVGMTNRLLTC